MKSNVSRRSMIGRVGAALAGLLAAPAARTVRAAVSKGLASPGAPRGYDPTQHKWVMAIDANRCIGCGLCVEACKKENHVPERPVLSHVGRALYHHQARARRRTTARGETLVDSPDGGHARLWRSRRCRRGHSTLLFRAQALQPLQAFSLCAGLPGGGDFRCAGRGGVDRSEVLHRLRFLHPGLSVWLPVPESGHAHGGEMHALLSSDYAGIEAGLRGGLPDPGAGLRRSEDIRRRTTRSGSFTRTTGCRPSSRTWAQTRGYFTRGIDKEVR